MRASLRGSGSGHGAAAPPQEPPEATGAVESVFSGQTENVLEFLRECPPKLVYPRRIEHDVDPTSYVGRETVRCICAPDDIAAETLRQAGLVEHVGIRLTRVHEYDLCLLDAAPEAPYYVVRLAGFQTSSAESEPLEDGFDPLLVDDCAGASIVERHRHEDVPGLDRVVVERHFPGGHRIILEHQARLEGVTGDTLVAD